MIADAPTRKIHLLQGDYAVVDESDVVLATILGSCVAACLHDPSIHVGGMNHFLLPGRVEDARTLDEERYGAHLMELLVNGLLKRGARRERLEAKLFGGARMIDGIWDIGERNAEFARRFLKTEGIPVVAQDMGGVRGRRIEYFPTTGRVRQIFMRGVPEARPSKDLGGGVVELF